MSLTQELEQYYVILDICIWKSYSDDVDCMNDTKY